MRPTRRLLQLLALWLLLGCVACWLTVLIPYWEAAIGLLVLALALEFLLLRSLPTPAIRRQVPAASPLAVWQEVSLQITPAGRRRFRAELAEHVPEHAETTGLPATLELVPGEEIVLVYRLRCLRRGDQDMQLCDLLLHGALGLLDQRRRVPLESRLKVYPNFAEVAKYALLATDNRLSQLGVRLRQRRGEGLEFHQLREYRLGDSARQVDWKATSRLHKLISREYQDERDQQVLILLDTGFRMRAQDNALSHFDQSLNASLLLAHAVTRQGDAVGLMTFSGTDRFLAPAKGGDMVRQIMNKVFDLEPTLCTPDYLRAVQDIGQRLRKRSLIVVVTNLRDEDGSDLLEACKVLGRRHLVLVATLREQLFESLHEGGVNTVEDAFTLAAAEDYLTLRQREITRLRHAGALVLDAAPEHLAVQLINQYLGIKRSALL